MVNSKNIRVLVLGGTGFIGSALIKKISKFNWQIDSVSINKIPEFNSSPNISFYQINLLDKDQLHLFLKDKSAI